MGRGRTYLIAAVATSLLALLIGAAIVAGGREPETFPAGSPEATVQAYFQALMDDQPLDAYELFSPDLQARCQPPNAMEMTDLAISRVTLADVDIDDDRGTVEVSVTQNWGSSPFGADESVTSQTVHLIRIGDRWRIELQPWPFFTCTPRS